MARPLERLKKNLEMADDPNKKGADAKRISKQPHEQAYQKRKAAKGQSKKSASKSAGNKK
jgi:hypothetical protein